MLDEGPGGIGVEAEISRFTEGFRKYSLTAAANLYKNHFVRVCNKLLTNAHTNIL